MWYPGDRFLALSSPSTIYLTPIPSHCWWQHDGLRGMGSYELPGAPSHRGHRPADAARGPGVVADRGTGGEIRHRLRLPARRRRPVAAGPALLVAALRRARLQSGVRPRLL